MDRAAFSLTPGKVSEVIVLGGTYYLLLVEEKKGGVTKPLKDLREEIERRLTQEERQKMQQGWLSRLRKKAFIKIY